MLEIWDEKLAEYAEIILVTERIYGEDKKKKKSCKIHPKITKDNEILTLNYVTECDQKERYSRIIKTKKKIRYYQKVIQQKGIHRDDFQVFINDKEIGIYGSQGQNRTAILTLKIAELICH